ncbi:MAG: anti-CBASS protein Acb1 family protein [Clostridia bacterium]
MSYTKKKNLYVPDSVVRKDFMTTEKGGSSKGKFGKDPLNSQYQHDDILTQREIDNMYKHKRIFQNIIEKPAEDCTREWITVEGENGKEILDKLNELNAQGEFESQIEYERLTGDGFISIGAKENSAFTLEDELGEDNLDDIEYLHAFSKKKVQDGLIDEDPFSKGFGEFILYELTPLSQKERLVHSSRILHFQSRVFEGEKWGMSLGIPLYEPILILDNIAWSLGQIAYAMTFKVLKSDDVSMNSREQVKSITEEMEKFFNSMSLAVIGKDEELTHESPGNNLPNISAMTEFVWDFLAGSARMPKSHMLGQQQGTITGGQYDSINYYMRIAGIQENYIRPMIERLIDLLYKAENSGVGNGSIDEPEYKLKFNPLWRLDRETDMELREIQSKIDERYIKNMVLEPDEVREKRFEEEGFFDELSVKTDELNEYLKMKQQAELEGE